MKNLTYSFGNHVLTEETSLFGKCKNIVLGVVAYLLWAEAIFWIYGKTLPEFMGVEIFQVLLQKKPLSRELKFSVACILAPVLEEALYRLHLSIAGQFQVIKGILLYAVVVSSILFGEAHVFGVLSVPVQGMAGLLFCYVYIKNGYSYISTVTMHFLINLYLYLQ